MNEVEKLAEQAKDEVKVQETVNLPWQKKMMLQDHRVVLLPDPQNPQNQQQRIAIENIVMDFKSFLLNANQREMGHHLNQILTGIKMLMDTCEQQQNDIDDLNGKLAELQKHLVI